MYVMRWKRRDRKDVVEREENRKNHSAMKENKEKEKRAQRVG